MCHALAMQMLLDGLRSYLSNGILLSNSLYLFRCVFGSLMRIFFKRSAKAVKARIQEPNYLLYGFNPGTFVRTLYMFEAATMYSAL